MDSMIGTIRAVGNHFPVRYNANMLLFLFQQLEKVADVGRDMHGCIAEYEVPILIETVEEAAFLIKKHSARFDFRDFYKVDFVKEKVKQICSTICAICEHVMNLDIESNVAPSLVDEDRKYMHYYLTAILEGVGDEELDEKTCEDLQVAIAENKERMKFLNIRIKGGDIRYIERIGSGSYGTVFKAEWMEREVAVKVFQTGLSIEAQAEFLNEVEIHKSMIFPNVVLCWGAIYAKEANAIVMELAKTDLAELRCINLTWHEKICLMTSASIGVEHLHACGVVHRDIKTPNFLVFEEPSAPSGYRVKIGDFGLALTKAEIRTRTMRPGVGTVDYLAPEIHQGKPHHFQSDIFSFGVVLFEIAGQTRPYHGMESEAMLMGRKERGVEPCIVEDSCPPELLDLMRACIAPEADKRPTMIAIVKRLKVLREQVNNESSLKRMF